MPNTFTSRFCRGITFVHMSLYLVNETSIDKLVEKVLEIFNFSFLIRAKKGLN
jgi:hypothetical protein